jgi:anti-anti-sigma regulatory factor
LTEKFRRLREQDLTVDLQYTTHIDQSAVDFFSHEAQTMVERDSRLTLIVNSKQRNFLEELGLHDSVELLSVSENEKR